VREVDNAVVKVSDLLEKDLAELFHYNNQRMTWVRQAELNLLQQPLPEWYLLLHIGHQAFAFGHVVEERIIN